MKARATTLLILTLFLAPSCKEQKVVETRVNERPWIQLEKQWEGVSGGFVEIDEPLTIGWGEAMTAVRWTGEPPKPPFELEYKAKRVNGSDFFGTVTFPVRVGNSDEAYLSLVVGGWGGATVGISSIDGKDASENETRTLQKFDEEVWYHIRLLRDGERIAAWIDGQKVVDINTDGKLLNLRPGEISGCAPFGFATWQTTGKIKEVRWRGL